MILAMLDIEPTVAGTAAAAMETIARILPDFILLDLGLPDRNGREVYKEIVKRWPSIPIILSTGHADAALIEMVQGNPRVRCLMKPYSIDALEAALAELA